MLRRKITIVTAGLFLLFLPFLFEYSTWGGVFIATILFSILLVFRFFTANPCSITFNRTDVLAGLYLGYGLINLLVRSAETDPLLIFQWISVFLLYCYVKTETGPGRKIWIYTLILSGVVQAIYGILQQNYFLETNHPLFEATGSFPNPGPYGGYLAICGISAFQLLYSDWNTLKAKRIFLLLALAFIGYGLWLSDSRAGWIAFGFPALWILLHGSVFVRRYRAYVYPAVILICAAGLFYLYGYRPASASGRLNIWKVCTTMIAEKPLFGHGPGSFSVQYMPAQARFLEQHPEYAESLSGGNNLYAFNEFIHLACEQGIIGLLLFLILLISAFFYRQRDDSLAENMRYGLAALLFFSCFSYPAGQYPLLLFFPFFLGIVSDRTTVFSVPLRHPTRVRVAVVFACFLLVGATLYTWRVCARFDRLLNSSLRTDDPAVGQELSRLYPGVRRVRELVLPYGKVLYRQGRYAEAVPVLERSSDCFASVQTLTDLGDAYLETGHMAKAEQCFSRAAGMAPLLIIPKYKLFQLYISTNRSEKALLYAEEIGGMKVKVINSVTIRIKSEIRSYLDETLNHESK